MSIVPLSGAIANVPADSSATAAVVFGSTFASAPTVQLTVLNPTAWDGDQLAAVLVGPPTTTGFTLIVSGGPAGSTISVSWAAFGVASTFIPTVTTGTVPQGRSGAQAITDVRDNADEYSLPPDTTVLRFLNRAIEEVERRLNGIFLWGQYPTVPNQTFVHLNDDIQYIESCNFSSGASNSNGTITNSSPLSQGSLVYPMTQLEQATFMDAAAGFPAVGFGPPQAFFIYRDQGSSPTNTVVTPDAPIIGIYSGTTSAPAASAGGTLSLVQTYVNPNGETTPSAASTQAITTLQQGIVTSPKGTSNASGYNVYALVSGVYRLQNAAPIALGVPYIVPGTLLTATVSPPTVNAAIGSGTGGAMFMQLYPAAMLGQVNVYYKARPMLWADTTTGSWTNLDTSMQEAVVMYATVLLLGNRSRLDEAETWRVRFEGPDGNGGMMASLLETVKRRTRPKSGRVRDVSDRSYPDMPVWAR